MFPGYLFIELDLEIDNTAPIRSTRGVIGLVRLGATLQPFPESILSALMNAQATTGNAIEPAGLFDVGEEVSLISGPMAGLRAIFKSHNSKRAGSHTAQHTRHTDASACVTLPDSKIGLKRLLCFTVRVEIMLSFSD